jgi:hypothetical protein
MTKNKKNTTHDIVIEGVLKVINNNNKKWTGTMTELNSNLNKVLGRKQSKVLPGSPSALRIVLNRVANRLRCRGISIRFARTNDHTRTRYVKLAE